MEVDAEKLLFLIEQRSAIYDCSCKDHANKSIVDKLWEEISTEIKSPVSECKSKWASLRSSYSRQLRQDKNKPSGSSGKRKRQWYLTDAMAFLKDHVNQHRSTCSNFDNSDEDIDKKIKLADSPASSLSQSKTSTTRNSPIPFKKAKISVSDLIAGPMIEFLQSKTKKQVQENSNSLFFKCMLADLENLSKKRQRNFRKHMSDLMHQMQEEEENDTAKLETPAKYKASTPQL